jgi:type II secretory pathway pseudopilin PulG
VALVVLLSLSLVLPAWLAVRVNHARVARAERDVEVIAEAIQRFERDNGFPPAWTRAIDGGPGSGSDQVDLLIGPGEMPRVAEGAGVGWLSGRSDSLRAQLGDNVPGYGRPRRAGSSGWNGPYLSARPTADPWGNRYIVSTAWAISAGPNGVLETPCVAVGRDARLVGDDVGVSVRDP